MPDRSLEIIDYLDPDQLPRQEFRNAGGPGDPVVNHQFPINAPVNLKSGHSLGRSAVLGDLPLQLDRVGA
jgi:hypothetical protein